MKFDVIIGNPPYQLNAGLEGGNSFVASAIYHKFIDKSLDLNPKYISMIVPSRWMNGSARGIPQEWSNKMINEKGLKEIHDYEDSGQLFTNVGITGGICFFLWDRENDADCTHYFYNAKGNKSNVKGQLDKYEVGSVIRDSRLHSIIDKVIKEHGKRFFLDEDKSFMGIVGSTGLFLEGSKFGTNWKDYDLHKKESDDIKYYVSKATNGVDFGWIRRESVTRNKQVIDLNKVYVPGAYGDPIRYDSIIGVPRYGEPGSIASKTYVVIGAESNFTEGECKNIISYMETKFFRILVRALKTTQSTPKRVYQFVPLQDWSKAWTDEELYKKYKLTQEEIDNIEETIAPMSTSDD